jgi:hypothetical protein
MKIIVITWSDNSKNAFLDTKEIESFIAWKRKNWPELTYMQEEMTREEYDFTSKEYLTTSK